jgi:signal transduction histidine kinase
VQEIKRGMVISIVISLILYFFSITAFPTMFQIQTFDTVFFIRIIIIVFVCWFPIWLQKKGLQYFDPDAADKIRQAEKARHSGSKKM